MVFIVSRQSLVYEENNEQKSWVLEAMIMSEPRRVMESGAGWRRSPQFVLHHILW